jgi:hypothetical protein
MKRGGERGERGRKEQEGETRMKSGAEKRKGREANHFYLLKIRQQLTSIALVVWQPHATRWSVVCKK